jgi:pimeloyl-ACP methyl ester carboxylesterase
MYRRTFMTRCAAAGLAAGSLFDSSNLWAQANPVIPLVPGPEVEDYKRAQQKLLAKYEVKAESHYIKLDKPPLTAHVLEAGKGNPVLLIHGGNAAASQFAPLMTSLQKEFQLFAADRPGCGLSDKFDYSGVPFREHAVDFLGGILKGLKLPKASIVANSMGGYWALVFALAHPELVSKLVLLGEPAGSGPVPGPKPPPAPKDPTVEGIRGMWKGRLGMNVEHVSDEIWAAELAKSKLPGAALAWDTMVDEFAEKQKLSTYALRPQLKTLQTETLFVWGDKDSLGTGAKMGQEMAEMMPHAHCEIVKDAGHLPWIDQTERCAQLTIEFLKSAAKN